MLIGSSLWKICSQKINSTYYLLDFFTYNCWFQLQSFSERGRFTLYSTMTNSGHLKRKLNINRPWDTKGPSDMNL